MADAVPTPSSQLAPPPAPIRKLPDELLVMVFDCLAADQINDAVSFLAAVRVDRWDLVALFGMITGRTRCPLKTFRIMKALLPYFAKKMRPEVDMFLRANAKWTASFPSDNSWRWLLSPTNTDPETRILLNPVISSFQNLTSINLTNPFMVTQMAMLLLADRGLFVCTHLGSVTCLSVGSNEDFTSIIDDIRCQSQRDQLIRWSDAMAFLLLPNLEQVKFLGILIDPVCVERPYKEILRASHDHQRRNSIRYIEIDGCVVTPRELAALQATVDTSSLEELVIHHHVPIGLPEFCESIIFDTNNLAIAVDAVIRAAPGCRVYLEVLADGGLLGAYTGTGQLTAGLTLGSNVSLVWPIDELHIELDDPFFNNHTGFPMAWVAAASKVRHIREWTIIAESPHFIESPGWMMTAMMTAAMADGSVPRESFELIYAVLPFMQVARQAFRDMPLLRGYFNEISTSDRLTWPSIGAEYKSRVAKEWWKTGRIVSWRHV